MKEWEVKYSKIFSTNLRRILAERGKTQAELARYIGVSRATISDWIYCRTQPRMDKVDKMCEFFNCRRSDLLDDHPVQKTGQESWYYDDEAAAAAQFLYENPEYKVLFDASRKIKKEDIELVKALLDKMKAEDEY